MQKIELEKANKKNEKFFIRFVTVSWVVFFISHLIHVSLDLHTIVMNSFQNTIFLIRNRNCAEREKQNQRRENQNTRKVFKLKRRWMKWHFFFYSSFHSIVAFTSINLMFAIRKLVQHLQKSFSILFSFISTKW